jgi:hypothetical protein
MNNKYYKYTEKHSKEIEDKINRFGRAVKTIKQLSEEGIEAVCPHTVWWGLRGAAFYQHRWAVRWVPLTEGISDELPASLRDERYIVWEPLRDGEGVPASCK